MERLALNISEAAEAAGISEPTMRQLVNMDSFPAMRIGRRWVIPVSSFNAWLMEQAANRTSMDSIT